MKLRAVLSSVTLVCAFVSACSSGTADSSATNASSSSSGSTSSWGSTSSSSSSGSASDTVCSPVLADGYFTNATAKPEARLVNVPCPAGFAPKIDLQGGGVAPSAERITSAPAFATKFCSASDGGASDGGAAFDFTANDVVALSYEEVGTPPTLMLKEGTDWLSVHSGFCGGAVPQHRYAFYAVPKSTPFRLESCTTPCHCGDSCPP